MGFEDLSSADETLLNPIKIDSSDDDEPAMGVPKDRSVYMTFDGPVSDALEKTKRELRTVVDREMSLKAAERSKLQRVSSPALGPFSELDTNVSDEIDTIVTDMFYPRMTINEIMTVALPLACALIVREIEGLGSLDEAKAWLAAYSHVTSF
tara:strand:+ start:459 stop:914 length:456 start_codon:yes stop_codon:yes gene_type:complete